MNKFDLSTHSQIKRSLKIQAKSNLKVLDLMSSPRRSGRLETKNQSKNKIFIDENFDLKNNSFLKPEKDANFLCELKEIKSKPSRVKSYCNKSKRHGDFYNETFGLPDNPSFSSKLTKNETILEGCQLDAYITNPSELSVLDLTYINQPWLVANPDVITHHPNLDVLIPFDEIRMKQSPIMHKFNRNRRHSADAIDSVAERNCVFTSTPFKCRTSNISVISTISLTKNEDKTGISALTSSLEKILAEAIKSENNIDKIDMKIEVITSPILKAEKFSNLDFEMGSMFSTGELTSSGIDISGNVKECESVNSSVIEDNKKLNNEKYQKVSKNKYNQIKMSPSLQVEPSNVKTNVKPKTERNLSKITSSSRILRSHSQERIASKKDQDEILISNKKYLSKTLPATTSELLEPRSLMHENRKKIVFSQVEVLDPKQSNSHLSSQNSITTSKEKFQGASRNVGNRSTHRSQDTNQLFRSLNGSTSYKKSPKMKKSLTFEVKPLSEATSLSDVVDRNANVSRKSLRLAARCSTTKIDSCLLKDISCLNQPFHNLEMPEKNKTSKTDAKFLKMCLSNPKVIHNPAKKDAVEAETLKISQIKCYTPVSFKNNGEFSGKLVSKPGPPAESLNGTVNDKIEKAIEKPTPVESFEHLKTSDRKLQNWRPLRRSFHSKLKHHSQASNCDTQQTGFPKLNGNISFIMNTSNNTTKLSNYTRLSELDVKNEREGALSKTMPPSSYSVETESLQLKSARKNYPLTRHMSQSSPPLDPKECSVPKTKLSERTERLKMRSRRNNFMYRSAVSGKNSEESSGDSQYSSSKSVFKPTMKHNESKQDVINNYKDLDVDGNQALKTMKDHIAPQISAAHGLLLAPKVNFKNEEEDLRENGIMSQIKIVISPMEMQDTNNLISPIKSHKEPHMQPTAQEEEKPTLEEDLIVLQSSSVSSPDDLSNFVEVPQVELTRGIKSPTNLDIVKGHSYKNGMLVWAQLGRYPYWPALICKDPVMRVCKRRGAQKKTKKTYYHIRFFNDRGRRAWILHSHVVPYRNGNDLDLLAQEAKRADVAKYRVSSTYFRKWKIAVEQIESCKNKTYREVHSFLVNSAAKKKQNAQKKLSQIETDSKVYFPETPDEHLTKKFRLDHTKTAAEEPPKNKFKIDEIETASEESTENKFNLEEMETAAEVPSENRDVRVSVSTDRSVGNVQDISAQHASVAVTPLDKSIEEIQFKHEEGENDLIEASFENCGSGSKTKAEKYEDPNKYSVEYQADLYRKNNLFNGLTKVKVCHYCLKEGEIYKCNGKCREYFHKACAAKVTEPQPQRGRKRKLYIETQGNLKKYPVINTKPLTRTSREQVEIVTVKSRVRIATPKKTVPNNFHELSLVDRIDYQMKAMMSPFENQVLYMDSSTDSSSEEGSVCVPLDINNRTTEASEKGDELPNLFDEGREDKKATVDVEPIIVSKEIRPKKKLIKHVTADSVVEDIGVSVFKCEFCKASRVPPCFICGLETSKRGITHRQKCTLHRCGKYYHTHCLKMWPQAQWSFGKWSRDQKNEDLFTCPAHVCHTCFSEELGVGRPSRSPVDKIARCLKCPAAFHTSSFCIPAGTEVLGGSQIVCPRHRSHCQPLNTTWCFICSEGGNLVCCDMCPTSVHPECQPIDFTDDDKYICEDCESGRFPLYDEIVWVKLGSYPWWPALILFPNEVPENVRILKHQRGDFAVRFFGTYDHYWVSKARSFLFQEGDRGASPGQIIRSKKSAYETFEKAIQDAAIAYKLKKEYRLRREAESIASLKPPSFIKINKNKPVGKVRLSDMDLSNTTACECDPNMIYPCGPDSDCINRLLMTECDPDVCPANNRCQNQSFEKREYPPLVPYKTQGRGWGLKCLKAIKKGQFVIEYVGELIDGEEYQRRIKKMHEQKEENYYFMTIDNDRMIDAGPKGNLSRFMNHSCNPNCETQKWTVKGDTRVGLFAIQDVEPGSEMTFNYNLECVGREKKPCQCGASNCSGFIGVKVKSDPVVADKSTSSSVPANTRKSNRRKTELPAPVLPACFVCSEDKSDLACQHKSCDKAYHLACLDLTKATEGSRFICPRHNCNTCSKRTVRFCVKCINSYCPSHSDGNVRHDKLLGFVCRFHDPKEVISEARPAKNPLILPSRNWSGDTLTVLDDSSTSRTNSLKTPKKKSKREVVL